MPRYKLEDIFNADEFGLFYAAPPKLTLALKVMIKSIDSSQALPKVTVLDAMKMVTNAE